MPDAPDGGKGIGRVGVPLAASATIVAAIGLYLFLSPQQDDARRRIAGMARRLVGQEDRARGPIGVIREDRARKPVGVIVREIEKGDDAQRVQAILHSSELAGAELAQVFPHLIRAMKGESEMVRSAAATAVGALSPRLSREAPVAENALTALLDDPSPALRATAVKSLGLVAASGQLDAPPPRLIACLDDKAEDVRAGATEALFEYRNGPEWIVPVALRRLPTEGRVASEAFWGLFWHVRLEPSVLPLLIGGLSSENTQVRLACTAAINHMGREGRPALPAIMTLLRKELEASRPSDSLTVHDMIMDMAAGAIGEVTADGECPPGSVEILCEILRRHSGAIQGSAGARPGSPNPSGRALQPKEELPAKAVWCLGILGRCAAPAVPLLLSTFESARKVSNLRGVTAEALAEISRGTPDEDRVLACLTSAWETSPEEQKSAIARAIRRLSPKSEQLVAGLREWPDDGRGSHLRRYRFPRSRRGVPVPE